MREYQGIAIPALCSEVPGCHKRRRMDSANFPSVFRVTFISQDCPQVDLVPFIFQLCGATINQDLIKISIMLFPGVALVTGAASGEIL